MTHILHPRQDHAPENDSFWRQVRREAETLAAQDSVMAAFLQAAIFSQPRLENAMGFILSRKLGCPDISVQVLTQVFAEAVAGDPEIGIALRADMTAVHERDPACRHSVEALLYFKGFQALQAMRTAHWLWTQGRTGLALHLQSRVSEVFSADIHPAARIGKAIMLDHATGIVIGETAVVEDEVSMLHGVTLGGTGKEAGDRHPKVRRGALLSVGAQILGNIEIGEYARVGAGSVVLRDVPPHHTAVGVPARILPGSTSDHPARQMDHTLPPGG